MAARRARAPFSRCSRPSPAETPTCMHCTFWILLLLSALKYITKKREIFDVLVVQLLQPSVE